MEPDGSRRMRTWGGIALLLLTMSIALYVYSFRLLPTTVPDVRGLSEEQAWSRLSKHGLTTVSTSYSPDSAGPPGRVDSQVPESGLPAQRRTTVHLVVSGKPPS